MGEMGFEEKDLMVKLLCTIWGSDLRKPSGLLLTSFLLIHLCRVLGAKYLEIDFYSG
jgi:hypothetical protein